MASHRLAPEYTAKGHPFWGGGRPRKNIPEKEELIALGEDLVIWAEEGAKNRDVNALRFCNWYTSKGFIMKQWEAFKDHPDFYWYYEKARAILAAHWMDGTVNQSIAHRYLRMYDPVLRKSEDQDADEAEARKAKAFVIDETAKQQIAEAIVKARKKPE